MGCDIHIVAERRKEGGEWIGIYSTDLFPGRRLPVAQRDYGFFAEVAAVRGSTDTTICPRNIPEDVSALAWQQYMTAPTDHHTPSWMTATEFVNAYFRANAKSSVKPEAREEFGAYDLLGFDIDEDRFEYRVVFWFDN